MFNMRGELIGIVNSKSFGTGIEGLGFAIPVNKAVSVSEELMTKGYVSGKPMIGVSFEDVSNDAGSLFFFGGTPSNVKPDVYVRSLIEGINDKELKEGDRVIAVNGEEIASSEDIKAAVSAASIGDKLTLQLYRDGKLMEVQVTVYERTPDIAAAASSEPEEKTSGSEEEKKNPDYKQLIDNLRTYSLLPYYLSDRYRKDAKQEVAKVEWSKQPRQTRSLYRYPIWLLKLRRRFLKTGSRIKQRLIKHR